MSQVADCSISQNVRTWHLAGLTSLVISAVLHEWSGKGSPCIDPWTRWFCIRKLIHESRCEAIYVCIFTDMTASVALRWAPQPRVGFGRGARYSGFSYRSLYAVPSEWARKGILYSKVHYPVQNSPLLDNMLNHMNSVQTRIFKFYFLIIIIAFKPRSSKWPVSFRFSG